MVAAVAVAVGCVTAPSPQPIGEKALASTTGDVTTADEKTGEARPGNSPAAKAAPSADETPPAAGKTSHYGKPPNFWIKKLEEETNFRERLELVRLMGEFGPQAKAAVPTLADLLQHENQYLVTAALIALEKIGPEAKPALPAAIAVLAHPYGTVHDKARSFVRRFGRDALPHLLEALHLSLVRFPDPALIENLRSSDTETRVLSARALELRGREAVPALVGAIKDRRKGNKTIRTAVRHIAISILGDIGPEAEEAVPALVELLETKAEFGDGEMAVSTLGKIGGAAVPALVDVLHERRHGAAPRTLAVVAFSQMKREDGIPALLKTLEHEEEWIGLLALEELANIADPENAAVVRAFAEAMTSDQKEYHDAAVRAFRTMGPAAVGPLADALGDDYWRVRAGAIMALTILRSKATSALPALTVALGDEALDVRLLAIEGLATVAPANEAVKEQLTGLLDDENPQVQQTARKFLERLEKREEKQ